MKHSFLLLVIFLCVAVLFSCEKDKTIPPTPITIDEPCDSALTYVGDIAPIMVQNCAFSGCHGNGSSQGQVALETYAEVVSAVNNRQLEAAVLHQSGVSSMPPGGKLSDDKILKIRCWIQIGMPSGE